MLVNPDSVNRAVFLLLYAPVCFVSLRWLVPRLSLFARRLTVSLLALQIAVMLMALLARPAPTFDSWLWNLDWEFNIPSSLASAQLALLGSLALAAAWQARSRPGHALFLAGIGPAFLFLAWDEYFMLHEHIADWQRQYAVLGAAMLLASAVLALRLPARERLWQICFAAGLAMSAVGAVIFEDMDRLCGDQALIQLRGCLHLYTIEEMLEFLGIWLALLAIAGQFSLAQPRPSRRLRISLALMPALWVVLLLLISLWPRMEWRLQAEPAQVDFADGVSLRGFRADIDADSIAIWIYATAPARLWNYGSLGYSIHLVDLASGDSIMGRDQHVSKVRDYWLFDRHHQAIEREFMRLELPAAPVNRGLAIALSFWREADDGFPLLEIQASDRPLLGAKQAILQEFAFEAPAAPATSPPIARFSPGISLQSHDMPAAARPGDSLSVAFSWRSDMRIADDYTQFLHLRHEESGRQWSHDQQPLGKRLPTRLWYAGLADSESWRLALPADLAGGAYSVYTGLYHWRDLQRLPAVDAAGRAWLDDRVPLGRLIVE